MSPLHSYTHRSASCIGAGNVRKVLNGRGQTMQETHYYPYGMPFGESNAEALATTNGTAVQPYKYGGKEAISMCDLSFYDFAARPYDPALIIFHTPDQLQEKYVDLFPHLYCAADPINLTDPTGYRIEGVSKEDAAKAVEDIRSMFSGDEFANFRNLIVQGGKNNNSKTLAPISSESLSKALDGVSLNEDQQALIDIVVNTINSKDIHKIEYAEGTGVLSRQAESAFLPGFMKGDLGTFMPLILEANGGIPMELITNQGHEGVTTPTKKGSFSIIISDANHIYGRAVTTGHEIFGHGRSRAVGLGDEYQHEESIRTENLIRRVMGIPYFRDGSDHGPQTIIPNPTLLPSFR